MPLTGVSLQLAIHLGSIKGRRRLAAKNCKGLSWIQRNRACKSNLHFPCIVEVVLVGEPLAAAKRKLLQPHLIRIAEQQQTTRTRNAEAMIADR